ncbi:zf-HC2 domain-containing protein [Streptomyces sp. JH34]|uniref:anti-sigma factor family protein n=1 Tax=Streptomyces sp. JH34 TaxID=2793633 RepID=UPI0023F839DB|nr:zf-HC2 domain-containing protein [Streptomyces sp. JH34]MDF6019993.1 zf-HC2 domain-containing protein [Streptomyces sp. JH34]
MTSTADTAQHPDVSEIADLMEGILPPSRAAEVRHHIESCAECGDIHASLEEIRSLLGAVGPLPEPMPEDVAHRIGTALAEEAASAATGPNAAARETEVTVGPAAASSVSRETYDLPTDGMTAPRPAGRPRGATGPGRSPARRRRRTIVLGTAFGAAAIGMSVFVLQSLQSSQDSAGSMADHGVSAAEKSHGDYSEGTLEGRVRTLLNESKASGSPGHTPAEPPLDTTSSPGNLPPGDATPSTRLLAPIVDVPPCVQQGTGRNAPALAVEEGSYEGTAAFLVVLPHVTDTSRVQAYVVDATCVDSKAVTKGHLLLTHSYARP